MTSPESLAQIRIKLLTNFPHKALQQNCIKDSAWILMKMEFNASGCESKNSSFN